MSTLVPTTADVNKIYTYCIRKITSSNETTQNSTDELPSTRQTSTLTESDYSVTIKQSADSETTETTNTSTDETVTNVNLLRDREKRSLVEESTDLTVASTVQTTQSDSMVTTNTATDPIASTEAIITTEVYSDYGNVSSASNFTIATTASIIYCVDEIVTASMNSSRTTTDLDLVSGSTDEYSNGSTTTSNYGISVNPTTNFASYFDEVSTQSATGL